MLSPLTRIFHGFRTYGRGVAWLLSHKRYLFLSFLPLTVGIIALVVGWGLFFDNQGAVMESIMMARPDAWYLLALWYLVFALVWLGVLGVSMLACLLMVNIIAAPVYEMVSVAVEKDLNEGKVEEVSLLESLKLIFEELKKVCFILFVSVLLLIIPGINVISIFVTAFLVGWDFYDYPVARRGWSFKDRLGLVAGDFWAVTAFGLWLVIPFLNLQKLLEQK